MSISHHTSNGSQGLHIASRSNSFLSPLLPWPESNVPALSGRKKLAIFGATGSIGASTLDIVRAAPESFRVVALIAGSNVDLLVRQCIEFTPEVVGLSDASKAEQLIAALKDFQGRKPEVLVGDKEISNYAACGDYDLQVAAIVGIAGLAPVYSALQAGKMVALANKESIVAAGHILADLISDVPGAMLLPLDSEHSALFQALRGYGREEVGRLMLTASGGPFLRTPTQDLSTISPSQAINHPRWSMGKKISVDSATMMNKAFEVIETCWLFGFEQDLVEVVVHPQSIVHSMVHFRDGSTLAQMSEPDMRVQIAYSLHYPKPRIADCVRPLDFSKGMTLEFEPLNNEKFKAVRIARECIRSGGNATLVLNVANEIAVQKFLDEKIRFTEIIPFIESALEKYGSGQCLNFEEILTFAGELNLHLGSSQ